MLANQINDKIIITSTMKIDTINVIKMKIYKTLQLLF